MSLPAIFSNLSLPLVGAPMFIVSGVELVTAQCKAGIVGTFPSANARRNSTMDDWLTRIKDDLAAHDAANPDKPAAPYGVNLIVNRANVALEDDLAACVRHKVPLVITSMGAREDVFEAVHSYGGIVLHDVINNFFAKKAVSKGADGLIAVAAGAGGHAGITSPIALIEEIRQWFDGPLALSGCISTGHAVLAAQAMGADLGYAGSLFIATAEGNAVPPYKQMIVDCDSADLVYTDYFSGVNANYLKPSIANSGLDPENLPSKDLDEGQVRVGADKPKAWRDIWGSGQGIGAIDEVEPTADAVARLVREYEAARGRLAG